MDTVECTTEGCSQGDADDISIADFVQLDFKKKRITLLDEERERLFSSYAEVDPLDPEARLSELNVSDALVSGGFGLRYRLTEKNPLHYRIDFAWGEDDFEVYFSIGEAF